MKDIDLSRLRRKLDFYNFDAPEWVRTIWSREEAFEWFVKNHRKTLTKNGALVRLGRDYFIDSETFLPIAKSILGVSDTHQVSRSSREENDYVS